LITITKPDIPALERLRQEDCKFKSSLGYIVRFCLKKPQQNKIKKQKLCQPQTQRMKLRRSKSRINISVLLMKKLRFIEIRMFAFVPSTILSSE
jgi:hypothetical protein